MSAHEDGQAFATEFSQRLAQLTDPSRVLKRLEYAAGQQLSDVADEIRRLAGVTGGSIRETLQSLLGIEDDRSAALVAP
jgi:hypothetical protein